MVSNIIKWRPWPPLLSKKFEVKLVIKKMECNSSSSDPVHEGAQKDNNNNMRAVEVRWKGSKTTFRRSVKRDVTKEEVVLQNGVVLWDQEFSCVCSLSGCKENVFYPWEIGFTVLNGPSSGPKNKVSVIGTASLNLAEYASMTEEKELDLNIPLTASCGTTDSQPSLHISISEDLSDEAAKNSGGEFEVLCNGKECCKEYIKNFLAAIPIRELEVDIRKGLISPTTIHQRLQIEFHYARLQVSSMSSPELIYDVHPEHLLRASCKASLRTWRHFAIETTMRFALCKFNEMVLSCLVLCVVTVVECFGYFDPRRMLD
ncbi:EEIG1/EHBP1 N-terminal domain-containing protein [Artemisia annua]|uniref:EEIG1/EHBP1 N-terminal domain-containing protein n=1 Tax=Artemisia annua TaxID=35608 RepID=A0A2U1KQ45_ARTAN|nr:EEIG1/EHBP1 N-terminal domain-containing protein [Artemisia annua]